MKFKVAYNTYLNDSFGYNILIFLTVISIMSIFYSYSVSIAFSIAFILLSIFGGYMFYDLFKYEYKKQYKKYKKVKQLEHENIIISKINKMLDNLPNDKIYLFYASKYAYDIAVCLDKYTLNYYSCEFMIDETKTGLEIGLHKNNELINNTEKFFDYDN